MPLELFHFFVCSKPKESFPDCQNVFGLGNISLMVTRHMHAIYLDIVCLSLLSKFSTFICLEREKKYPLAETAALIFVDHVKERLDLFLLGAIACAWCDKVT